MQMNKKEIEIILLYWLGVTFFYFIGIACMVIYSVRIEWYRYIAFIISSFFILKGSQNICLIIKNKLSG